LSFEDDKTLHETIKKIALLNAIHHHGKAQLGPVLGKLLMERSDLKIKVKEISKLISQIIDEVNRLDPAEQIKIVETNWPQIMAKEKVEEKKKLPPLPNADKYAKIVTRFSPNPDCVLHLGSARAIILSHEYAKLYKGLFILRFEDTDPKLKRPVLEFYEAIREDLEWLGCKPDAEYIQSDRVRIYYEYAEKLLKEGNAYVCTCNPEEFRNYIIVKKACPCREKSPEEHLNRWEKMQNGTYSEGEAVVRIKSDLEHPNPAVRDWPALRIIDTKKYPHPRIGSKYHVWPLYNFACGIDDHLMGVTHIIRGKEHLTNQIRQEYLYKHLGWTYPEAIHYGRLKITGAYLSKSKIVQGIREGIFKSWDDPRLATFKALRRRGITPEAIRQLIIDAGPKTVDIVLSWENLNAYNRKILDPIVNRYFFVNKPIEATVKDIPHDFVAKMLLHPNNPEKGYREFFVRQREGKAKFWVSADDAKLFQSGCIIRFMELFNVKIEKVESYAIEASFHSERYEEAKKLNAPLIHWLPIDSGVPCQVVMPNASLMEGIAETNCKILKPGTIIQFERFGFVRIDNVNQKITAYFAHR
jgi:glutamyl-tRNA synthetase